MKMKEFGDYIKYRTICFVPVEFLETNAMEISDAVCEIMDHAEAGSAYFQCKFAEHYGRGDGIAKDEAKAIEWYKKAAEQGNYNAWDKLGDCYYNGTGVEQSYKEAVRCYHESVSQNTIWSLETQYKLAECYFHGIGTEKNEQEAFRWYKKSAKDNTKSKYKVAECYYHGFGIKQDYKSAIEWYNDFIQSSSLIRESDYYDAKYKIAECYYHGFGVKQNYEEVIKRYEEINNNTSKENKRILDSRCRLGDCYYHIYKNELEENNRMAKSVLDGQRSLEDYNLNVNFGKKLKYAINYYESAALKGHTEAMFKLGDCYYNGIIGLEQNYDKAITWYQKITEGTQIDAKIIVQAQCCLGDCYYNKKTEDDVKKAIEYYQKALAGGHEEIQSKLREVCYKEAERYYYGKDETWIDYEDAVELYQESAKLGYAAAQYKLGCIYKTGLRAVKFDTKRCMESYQGLKKDILLAAQWLKKAMEQGYENAQKEYNSLFTIFTVGQLQKHGFVREDD